MAIKYEIPQIKAPRIRRGLPCFDLSCCLSRCRKRAYITELLEREMKTGVFSCGDLECKRRVSEPVFIKITFCVNAKCEHFDRDNIRCKLVHERSGRLSFQRPRGILRMNRGSDKGWHYRKL